MSERVIVSEMIKIFMQTQPRIIIQTHSNQIMGGGGTEAWLGLILKSIKY